MPLSPASQLVRLSTLGACAFARVITPLRPGPLILRGGRAVASAADAADVKLRSFRKAMADAGVAAFVVPSGDAHLSEYTHPAYDRRAFLSGFTGSAGTAVVTADAALLWTDGRYFLQAEQELSPEWTLMRAGQPGVPSLESWLASNLPDASAVGIDASVHSVDEANTLRSALDAAQSGLRLEPLSPPNLVDSIWTGRPPPPLGKARLLPLSVAGASAEEKLAAAGEDLDKAKADALVLGSLDEVCWLLNVRGADVPHCPVLQAFALVHATHPTSATLFVERSKLDDEVSGALAAAGVAIAPYEEAEPAVRRLADEEGKTLLIDPKSVNYGLRLAAGGRAALATSPLILRKARKNAAELAGMLEAHLTDAAALAHFFAWLERVVVAEATPLTEVEIATKLASFRAAQPGFIDLSFPTIAGAGSNGAIIHYDCMVADAARVNTLDGSQMMLLDSGGQYATGTTDVTRTFHLGTPTDWQRECFTRVLKGNIGLDTLTFPEGTPGMAIDAFARQALWQAGLDYLHGTGHGVGAALNVHEGPHSISARWGNTCGLEEGMICSNEPGYYEAGAFGIRIENLLVARAAPTPNAFNGKAYLRFDQLTHVPIQASLLEPSLLTSAEVEWLDAYHARVWERVSPRVDADSEGARWLRRVTRPLAEQGVRGLPPSRTAAVAEAAAAL
ncbi:hypothetical protein EMIHUDRAFT_63427 [Emiliania huxleyi CCMP1516]|uniref:Uncharacterized protein n=4 Tax=Emiliania huxleyi TaxID=2903 RepID=A0A0D3KBI0_EMIH1|nr:hypothetical protein EMIHUDRAFT_63427 [Emiliania huxleyi CCMP1516]EOD33115.1 hypothetical protein EMIHUDRAFT_63427 [Emiliania huxleyi CCMP1516]|eukprot:XP_005785544.1 hypothetical protein EMIHUDRAFT_63427 [Emiliania huxleyi CCMP1516]